MAQTQTTEKLHAACDECRTRKLKCSGEKPICGRCQREKIECIYSPQKAMGRPKKRRREGEADAPSEQPASTQDGHDSSLNGSTTQPISRLYRKTLLDTHRHSFGPTPPIHPSLWDAQVTTPDTPIGYQTATQDTPPNQTAMGPCTCLALTFLTLTDLQTVPTFSFPQVIIPLRKAMTTVSSLIHCPICPLDAFSAIQNVSSIVSLFKAIVERFSKVLHEVDLEASRLSTIGSKKPYRIGDNNPALSHLHTGTLDCPMGFNIELEPDVWKKLVKTALRTEMYGGGSNPAPLKQLLKEVEERQQRWYRAEEFLGEERRRIWGREHYEGDKGVCESLGGEQLRRAIGILDWE
ncbi:hypothetical protein BU25DRAFT_331276 [Macroventuria anomochaeta]|uniref:Uncharacterized protein n=1 Tax=Macroventuria anomochaeta TaxID=301207 RepID=A0ACB6SCC6_9PLEO|nr:uncharacterized protein BU25DRAFT_331276 [Macroventuria anomochaeta]KAF2631950.1 hypothetical protein BU25DRAFT_331276 [Macroventuria anomochaeta]